MHIRALTVTLVLAAAAFSAPAASAAPATAAPATAAVRLGPQAAAPRPTVVSLHAEFTRLLAHVKDGPIGGVVPSIAAARARTAAGPASAPAITAPAATACTEPDCNVSYHGGQVQHSPHVYLVLWGNWSGSAASAAEGFLAGMYQGLGATPQDSWSTITTQYADTSGAPTFGDSVLAGYVNDTSTPPDPVTSADLGAEAAAYAATFGLTDLADAQVVIASAPGTCFSDDFAGNCGTPSSSSGGYCGWHSYVTTLGGNLPYTNLPFQLDAGYECGENWINQGYLGEFDGFTTVGGHEYAETVTDPFPDTGWYDPADVSISGGEIADKCAWGGAAFGVVDPAGDVSLTTGRYAMQSLWSNAAGRCLLTTAPKLTLTSPGTQQSLLGHSVRLQISAATNDGMPLGYAARGLPPGLSIDSYAGLISGVPAVTAGTWHPVVVVTAGPLSRTVTFGWQVSSLPGAVKGYAGKCVDDSGGHTGNGTKIDLWRCTGETRQRITFAASGELRVVGKCVTAGKAVAFLWSCSGAAAQTWTRQANGSYVVASTRRCLTAASARNGAQLTLAACKSTAAQHWSLP